MKMRNAQKQTNKKKIIYRFKNDNSFKREINEIARSRKMLYLNCFQKKLNKRVL